MIPAEFSEPSEETLQQWALASRTPAIECPSLDDPPPPWVDKGKFRRGQEFVQKYTGLVAMSYVLASSQSFVLQTVFNVLLYNRKFESVPKCMKRFLYNKDHVLSWNRSDLWDPVDPAYRSMSMVQQMHQKVGIIANRNRTSVDTSVPNTSLEPKLLQECTLWSSVRKDLKDVQLTAEFELPEDHLFMSQFDNMTVIFGMIAPILVVPELLGLHGVSEEEYEDFLHMWRVLAYYLGVQDKFNLCSGSLQECRAVGWQYLSAVTLPAYKKMSQVNEYIFRMHVESGSKFLKVMGGFIPKGDVVFLYVMGVVNVVSLPECYKSLGWVGKAQLWGLNFILRVLMRISWIRKFVNFVLTYYIDHLSI